MHVALVLYCEKINKPNSRATGVGTLTWDHAVGSDGAHGDGCQHCLQREAALSGNVCPKMLQHAQPEVAGF